jgi:hypothetical protein
VPALKQLCLDYIKWLTIDPVLARFQVVAISYWPRLDKPVPLLGETNGKRSTVVRGRDFCFVVLISLEQLR